MRITIALSLSLALAAVAAGIPSARAADRPPAVDPAPAAAVAGERALVEIAIVLDTSNSMDGLIDQARARLWSVVNDLARARRDGRIPDLRVALYEYGNSGIEPSLGWVRQVVPLTTDLDAVSAALFALRTGGGSEHCGQAIARAVGDLAWSPGDHYRALFIAGNEPFSQGPVPYASACAAAVGRGVVVNTIHCGPRATGLATGWVDGARLGQGGAVDIAQDRVEAAVATPQDARIAALNHELNGTYVAYGAHGAASALRQVEQDGNALSLGSSSLSCRVQAKAGAQYRNGGWDLVDACAQPGFDLAAVPEAALGDDLRRLDLAARRAHIAAMAARRAALRAELLALAAAREAHLAALRAHADPEPDDTFGAAMRALLREQLARKGYHLDC